MQEARKPDNTGADLHVHQRRLVRVFVICLLVSKIHTIASRKVQIIYLVSVPKQTALYCR